jgi:hypothetical protein
MGVPLPHIISFNPLAGDDPVVSKIISLSMQFWRESSQRLADAVNAVNFGTGPRCFFANVPFTENNSAFAPQPWLFGLGPAPDFSAQDEVSSLRRLSAISLSPAIFWLVNNATERPQDIQMSRARRSLHKRF